MALSKLALVAMAVPLLAAVTFQAEIAKWRQKREAGLRRDGGWLTVTGLFWLHEGQNTFGTDAKNDVALPAGPAHAGVFELRHGKVFVSVDGRTRQLRPDSEDRADTGRLHLYVIERGGRFAIRMKDPESQFLHDFHGLD